MKRVTRIIGAALLALAAFAMLAGDLFMASASQPDYGSTISALAAHDDDLNSFARKG